MYICICVSVSVFQCQSLGLALDLSKSVCLLSDRIYVIDSVCLSDSVYVCQSVHLLELLCEILSMSDYLWILGLPLSAA